MTRPFIFRIHAAEFFALVQNLSKKEKGQFLSSFANDLITLNPSLDYSKKVIQEAIDFQHKKKTAGALGGRPKKSKGLAEVKQTKSKPKANRKPETETETEIQIPPWIPLDSWNDFIQNRIELKKPMTDLAKKKLIEKLATLQTDYDIKKLLDVATEKGWLGVYPSTDCLAYAPGSYEALRAARGGQPLC